MIKLLCCFTAIPETL